MSAIEELDTEIAELEKDLEALRRAREALARRHRPLDEPSAAEEGATAEGDAEGADDELEDDDDGEASPAERELDAERVDVIRERVRAAQPPTEPCDAGPEGCGGRLSTSSCGRCGYTVSRCAAHGGGKSAGGAIGGHRRFAGCGEGRGASNRPSTPPSDHRCDLDSTYCHGDVQLAACARCDFTAARCTGHGGASGARAVVASHFKHCEATRAG